MGLQPLPLLLFLAWAASASAEAKVAPGSLGPSPEAALLDWARSRGAEINVHIGAAHEGGARGTLADRDFLPREVVVKVPFNSTVALSGDPFAWAAEHAYAAPVPCFLEILLLLLQSKASPCTYTEPWL